VVVTGLQSSLSILHAPRQTGAAQSEREQDVSALKRYGIAIWVKQGWRSVLEAFADAFAELKLFYAFLGAVGLFYILVSNWDVVIVAITSQPSAAYAATQNVHVQGAFSPASGARYLPAEYVNQGREDGNVMTYEHD
jgi:hypothetical protein